MVVTKTEVVSVRAPPDVKAAQVTAAEQERRSLASGGVHGAGLLQNAWRRSPTSPCRKDEQATQINLKQGLC